MRTLFAVRYAPFAMTCNKVSFHLNGTPAPGIHSEADLWANDVPRTGLVSKGGDGTSKRKQEWDFRG